MKSQREAQRLSTDLIKLLLYRVYQGHTVHQAATSAVLAGAAVLSHAYGCNKAAAERLRVLADEVETESIPDRFVGRTLTMGMLFDRTGASIRFAR